MKNNNQLSISFWKECLDYDPNSGSITWKQRPVEHFKTRAACTVWNKRFSGKPSGSPNSDGYIQIGMKLKLYKAHRLAWALHHGEYPSDFIDHINGIPNDNRISNLRVVSKPENCQNQKRRMTNSSGQMGVSRCNSGYRSYIQVDGKRVYLGVFPKIEDAVSARKEAEIKYGYHENHGR